MERKERSGGVGGKCEVEGRLCGVDDSFVAELAIRWTESMRCFSLYRLLATLDFIVLLDTMNVRGFAYLRLI